MRETYSRASELNRLRAAQKHVSVFNGWLIVLLSKVVAGHKREGYRLKRTEWSRAWFTHKQQRPCPSSTVPALYKESQAAPFPSLHIPLLPQTVISYKMLLLTCWGENLLLLLVCKSCICFQCCSKVLKLQFTLHCWLYMFYIIVHVTNKSLDGASLIRGTRHQTYSEVYASTALHWSNS